MTLKNSALTYHMPNLESFLLHSVFIKGSAKPEEIAKVCKILIIHVEELLAPRPNPKLEDQAS